MWKRIQVSITLLLLIIAVGSLIQLARLGLATSTVAEAMRRPVAPFPSLGTTRVLTILPLVDEAASRTDLQSEHGLAYLIQTEYSTVLFDVGMNAAGADPSPLLANAERLGVDLSRIDTLVFSHIHPDHVGGVRWWRAESFAFGNTQEPLEGIVVLAPAPLRYPGLEVKVTSAPTGIAPGIATTGSIPFVEVFPLSLWRTLRAEQALAVNVEGQGIVLIVGCGHPGIEQIVTRAEAVFDAPIIGVVGGLHYEGKSAAEVAPSIAFLRARTPRLIALSPHDSSPAALQAFRDAFPAVYQDIEVGRAITISN